MANKTSLKALIKEEVASILKEESDLLAVVMELGAAASKIADKEVDPRRDPGMNIGYRMGWRDAMNTVIGKLAL